MQVYYATSNKGKFFSLCRELDDCSIELVQAKLDIPEPRSDDLKYIAKEKVMFAYEHLRSPVVALDAGFYIPTLNNFPKAFVNFALETIGLEGILKLCENKEDKSCEFRNCLAYCDSLLKEPIYFEDKVQGNIADNIYGSNLDKSWSKLWMIFIPYGSNKTLAQMSDDEREQWRIKYRNNTYAQQFKQWHIRNRKK